MPSEFLSCMYTYICIEIQIYVCLYRDVGMILICMHTTSTYVFCIHIRIFTNLLAYTYICIEIFA